MSVSLGNSSLFPSCDQGTVTTAAALEWQHSLPFIESPTLTPLLSFLETKLVLNPAEIALGLAQAGDTPSLLPMALWQFGLISLAELEEIFDWLEDHPHVQLQLPKEPLAHPPS